MTARIASVVQMSSPASRFASEMSMISVERIRSVRTAPSTSFFSSRSPSSAWPCCTPNHSSTFSAPSKQRYAPPRISRYGSTQGAKAVSSRAIGMMMTNLFASDPSAILRDHRQLARGRDALHVLRSDGGVIDHDAGGFGRGLHRGAQNVVDDGEQTNRHVRPPG